MPRARAPAARTSGAWSLRESRSFRSPYRSALRGVAAARMASADSSLRPWPTARRTSPFQAWGEASPDKNTGLPCTTAGFTPPPFGHKGFAVCCPLALVGVAWYPVSVRRPAGSFPASFSLGLATVALRFPWVPVTKFPEDSHLRVSAHAGRTKKGRAGIARPPSTLCFAASPPEVSTSAVVNCRPHQDRRLRHNHESGIEASAPSECGVLRLSRGLARHRGTARS